MKVLSLFANIGVAEAYLSQIGVDVVLANELVERRAALYSAIYPHTNMVCGDITSDDVYQKLISESRKEDIDVIMATPPCQGISRAGKQYKDDVRNLLILPVIKIVKELYPKYVFIENVPQFVETYITLEGNAEKLITDYIASELDGKYTISANVIDTKNYGVPQTRQRAILLLSRVDQKIIWKLPKPDPWIVTLEDAIGKLPPLDPYVKDASDAERHLMFPQFACKAHAGKKVSPWHFPPEHIKRQVVTMIHTPTGKTAFDNPKYVPIKADGSTVRGYKSTYRRLRWDAPACTVTMDNRKISSQNNVHPGRYVGINEEGTPVYSDPRVLSIFELMKIMSLPDDWPLPHDANPAFVRSIIGEGIPPLFVKKVFETLNEMSYA